MVRSQKTRTMRVRGTDGHSQLRAIREETGRTPLCGSAFAQTVGEGGLLLATCHREVETASSGSPENSGGEAGSRACLAVTGRTQGCAKGPAREQ